MMSRSRTTALLVALLLASAIAGCAKKADAPVAPSGAPPSIEATARAGAEASAEATALESGAGERGSPAPAAAVGGSTSEPETSPTGPVNLLSAQAGTILRSWPASGTGLQTLLGEGGWSAKAGSSGPYEVVYELAGPGTIQQFIFYSGSSADDAQTLRFAVSSTSATSGFIDVGTYQLTENGRQDVNLNPPVQARWIKMTIEARGSATKLGAVAAMGTLATRASAPPVGGVWKYFRGDPYGSLGLAPDAAGVFPSSFDAKAVTAGDSILDMRQAGSELSAGICTRHFETALRGSELGSIVDLTGGQAAMSPAVVNSEGTLMIGYGGAAVNWFAARLSGSVSCDSIFEQAAPRGAGESVLELFTSGPDSYPPYAWGAKYPGYRIVPLVASLFDQKTLGAYRIVVLSSVCDAASVLSKTQAQTLMDWVYSGNKLIIHDADNCTSTDYSFLPYAFTSSNPGAHAARGNNLMLVESNTLGSDAPDVAHLVDVKAYVATTGQQLGDANVVTTQDSHWCGHLFGTNVLGQNGFVQMFAPLGQGLIIYDGLDRDDGDIAQYQKVTLLELQQPPDAALACDQLVSVPFIIAPSSVASFAPGKALTFPLSALANHGFKGSVNLAVRPPANAGWQTALSTKQVVLNGDTANFNVTVDVPQDAKPGSYAFVVKGTDEAGHAASATLTIASSTGAAQAPAARAALVASTPKIAKTLATQKRVAVYGIYFDFASATLRPESAPVLKEIADALKANPSWKLTIEGHTDDIGGADYNLDLSKRRALAVKDALVARYHIQASRLHGVGYGFSRPKASNDAAQGRALNRRVELVRG